MLVVVILEMLVIRVTNCLMNQLSSWIFDFHNPTLVSCITSQRSIKWKGKSFIDMSLIVPSLVGLAISIVKCPMLGSCPRIDRGFCFLTLLNVDPELITRDKVSLLWNPSSFLFLFLSKVSSNHDYVLITLDVVQSMFTLNNFLLIEVNIFVAEEKGFFGTWDMSFEASRPFFVSVVLFAASSDSVDSLSLLPPSPRYLNLGTT